MNVFESPTIRYLGNKRRLLPLIQELMQSNHEPGTMIVDLFAGSNSVAYHFLDNYRIITNDIEGYSYFIGKALIEYSSKPIDTDSVINKLYPAFQHNRSILSTALYSFIEKENQILAEIPNYKIYSKFCSDTPYISNFSSNGLVPEAKSIFSHASLKPTGLPYCLFSTYFMNSYFGVQQCIDIDSIRYAIDVYFGPFSKPKDEIIFSKTICSLLYTLSNCVASPGHFAQASHPNNKKIYQRILKERKKDVWEIFSKTLKSLFLGQKSNSFCNLAYQYDALNFLQNQLKQLKPQNDILVYIDPPYTADHYSRYYHILNTLLTYDYPDCEFKGRYRSNRFTSLYSLSTKALGEITKLLGEANNQEVKVMMSYRAGGLVPLPNLYKLCVNIFNEVHWVMIPFMHSSQGRTLEDNNHYKNSESIFVCTPKPSR